MKNTLAVLTLSLSAIALTACDSQQTVVAEDLMHHRFELVKANDQTISNDGNIYIEFGENLTLNGKMCNRFFGQSTLQDGVLKSSGLAMTKMLCGSEQLNQLDNNINQLLKNGANITLTDKQLTLKKDDIQLEFTLKDLL